MASATLTPTEDDTFDALFGWIARTLELPDDTEQVVKGFQNLVASPTGSYIVVSPGMVTEQDFGAREYDSDLNQQIVERHVTLRYQVDCYGPLGPTWASILSVAWRSMWGVDNMLSGAFTPLYADAPQQLNITNAEGQFETRYMIRLHGQVNQRVGLPQDFFTEANIDFIRAADQLP